MKRLSMCILIALALMFGDAALALGTVDYCRDWSNTWQMTNSYLCYQGGCGSGYSHITIYQTKTTAHKGQTGDLIWGKVDGIYCPDGMGGGAGNYYSFTLI